MPDSCNDPAIFQEFRDALAARDSKTVAAYLATMRDFVTWLGTQPGGAPFHLGLLTETAVRGYMDSLQRSGRAPRTRSKALSGLRRFCQWTVDEGYLRRHPARAMERPKVVEMAPTELSEQQRFVLKQLVEQHAPRRFAAIFALGYWAGLRISEIAALRMDQCQVNQRAGSITLVDAKGGTTRTLDLHNMARRALYNYLFPEDPHEKERDQESVYVFTSQRAAWLRQQGHPDHLSERGIEHLWMQVKHKGTHEEWQIIAGVTFHDLRHDFAHRACCWLVVRRDCRLRWSSDQRWRACHYHDGTLYATQPESTQRTVTDVRGVGKRRNTRISADMRRICIGAIPPETARRSLPRCSRRRPIWDS